MPFIPVENTVRAEMRMSLDSQNVENTLWFEKPDLWTVDDLENLGTNLISWWTDEYAPQVISGVALREVFIREFSSLISIEATVFAAAAGSLVEQAFPNNVAFSISFRTGLTGRSFRGRNYIVGVPRSVATANTVTTVWANATVAAYAALPTFIDVPGATHVVVSLYSGGVARAAGVTTSVLSYTYADLTLDSQRNRLPGRGV